MWYFNLYLSNFSAADSISSREIESRDEFFDDKIMFEEWQKGLKDPPNDIDNNKRPFGKNVWNVAMTKATGQNGDDVVEVSYEIEYYRNGAGCIEIVVHRLYKF